MPRFSNLSVTRRGLKKRGSLTTRVMESRDITGQLFLLAFAAMFLGTAVFSRAIYRRDTGQPDPHQTRARIAFAALGLAILFLWFAEYRIRYIP